VAVILTIVLALFLKDSLCPSVLMAIFQVDLG